MNYYEILGVATDATPEQIKAAHKKLVKKYHPDTKHGNEEKFLNVQHAYDILKDPEKRAHYDKTGRDFVPEEDNSIDIIAALFNALLEKDVPVDNYIDAIREALKHTLDETKAKMLELNQDNDRYRKLQKRLKKKKQTANDTEFFFAALSSKIANNETRLGRAEKVLADANKALTVLADYEDTGDPEKRHIFTQQTTSGRSFFARY